MKKVQPLGDDLRIDHSGGGEGANYVGNKTITGNLLVTGSFTA